MRRSRLPGAVLIAAGLAWPGDAAASCLGLCTCSVVATGVTFGSYNPLSSSNVDANGNVAVTCRVLNALNLGLVVAYQISLSTGASGSYAPRTMKNGVHALNYNLYTSGSYGTVWSTGAGAVSDSYLLLLLNTTRNYTIFGRIPGSQNLVPVGSYSDPTITVTVTY